MPYVMVNGTPADLIPYEPRMGMHFESAMHLPLTLGPNCSIQGTSVAVIEAQAQGTHQNSLPEGIQPWQELPK